MSKTILVTGINGFVGKHLANEFYSRNMEIIGVGQRESNANPVIKDLLAGYYQCNATKADQVAELPLERIDCIVNLAGLANVGASFDNPDLYMDINVKVLSVLGDALLEKNPTGRMIAVSTGALYDPSQAMPLNEGSKTINKGSPYALSKLAMEQAASKLVLNGLDCIIARPFNHIGPGQGLGFLIPDLMAKLQATSPGRRVIKAGNLKTVRDYSDVRDIAKAYAVLCVEENLNNQLYNVCSGSGHSGEEIVKSLCEVLKIDFEELEIEVDQTLIRPTDPQKIVGDNTRLKKDSGWSPSRSLDETVEDIVESLS